MPSITETKFVKSGFGSRNRNLTRDDLDTRRNNKNKERRVVKEAFVVEERVCNSSFQFPPHVPKFKADGESGKHREKEEYHSPEPTTTTINNLVTFELDTIFG